MNIRTELSIDIDYVENEKITQIKDAINKYFDWVRYDIDVSKNGTSITFILGLDHPYDKHYYMVDLYELIDLNDIDSEIKNARETVIENHK